MFTLPKNLEKCAEPADVQIVVPEPDALIGFSTTKIPVSGKPPEPFPFANGLLADTVPALVHAKIIEGLENSNCFRSVTRNIDGMQADLQLALSIRNFSISTETEPVAKLDLAARAITNDGKNIATTAFHELSPVTSMDAAGAVAALNEDFGAAIRKLVPWLSSAVANREKAQPEPRAP